MGRFSFFLAFLILAPLYGQSYYLSDGLGSELEPLSAISGDEEWYLSREEDSFTRIRTLFHNQSEIKRWETVKNNGESVESYFYKSGLREINEYNSSGQLVSEQFYDPNGNFLEHRIYIFDKQERVRELFILDEEGLEIKSHTLVYRDNGSLRALSGTVPGDEQQNRILWRSQDYDRTFLEKMYMSDGSVASLYSYESGRLKIRSTYLNEVETKRTLYTYSTEGVLDNETTWNYTEDSLEVLYYNKQSRVILENSFIKGILRVSVAREYKDDQLIRYEERSDGEKILWEYEYSENLNEPVLSSFYRNDILVKKIQRDHEMMKETVYRNNQPVYEKITDISGEGDDS